MMCKKPKLLQRATFYIKRLNPAAFACTADDGILVRNEAFESNWLLQSRHVVTVKCAMKCAILVCILDLNIRALVQCYSTAAMTTGNDGHSIAA